jgi:DNA mismatch repair protein MutL
LFLEMDPSGVDVNIHPAKREVRFHDDFTLRQFIVKAVQETLLAYGGAPAAKYTFEEAKPAPSFAPLQDRTMPLPKEAELSALQRSFETVPPPMAAEEEPREDHRPPLHLEREIEPLAAQPVLPLPEETQPRAATPRPEPLIHNRLGLRVLGCVGTLYLVAEGADGLVLIDQHAAHERVLFEQMLKRMALQDPAAQQLLFPVTLEFLPREADFVMAQIEPLQKAGVGIAAFGPGSFLVDAQPAMVKPRDVGAFIRTILSDLQHEGGETRKARRLSEEVVAKTVCRHAVKANDALRPPEWDQLLHDLLACDLPYTCPHGRPTMIELSFTELEKKFGRAV